MPDNKIKKVLQQLTYNNNDDDVTVKEQLDNIAQYSQIARKYSESGSIYNSDDKAPKLEDFKVKHYVNSLDKLKNGQNLSMAEQEDFNMTTQKLLMESLAIDEENPGHDVSIKSRKGLIIGSVASEDDLKEQLVLKASVREAQVNQFDIDGDDEDLSRRGTNPSDMMKVI